MDKLNSFLTGLHSKTMKIASAQVSIPELSLIEKRAYAKALAGTCMDESFLEQFEGSEMLPQAIVLCEQELAMEQRQLQQRMQQMAQAQNDTWQKDSIEQDGLRLQKQQLVLALFKSKAMTPAPQPGDAEIGTPDPAAQMMAQPADAGAAAGTPVQEPKVASKTSGLLEAMEASFGRPFGKTASSWREEAAKRVSRDPVKKMFMDAAHRESSEHGVAEGVDAMKRHVTGSAVAGGAVGGAVGGMVAKDRKKKANVMSALVPGAKTTAGELGAALRLRTQQRGAQQLAQTLGHTPSPGMNPFNARTVSPPPSWVGKTAGTGRTTSAGGSKPKPKARRAVRESVSFGALIDQLAGGAS